MAGDAIRVEGLRDLTRALRQVDEDLPNEVKAINRDAAEDVLQVARQLVPRGTRRDRRSGHPGALAGTLRVGATRRSAVVKAGTRRVPYAGPIHFGWPDRHIPPQPFLYVALDRRRDEVVQAYAQRLQALVDRVIGSGAA